MLRSVATIAVVASAFGVAGPAIGAPVVWKCTSEKPSSNATTSIVADYEGSTLDGKPADTSPNRITLRERIGGDAIWTMLDVETGKYAIDSVDRGSLDSGICVRPEAASPAVSSAAPAMSNVAVPTTERDARATELESEYLGLIERARGGKLRYLQAARLYQEKIRAVFPEHSGNVLMNEYLAFMAVLGEKIDLKRMTEAEAQYELAKKMSELHDRALAAQARSAPQQDASPRRPTESSPAAAAAETEGAARIRIEEERLALQREIAERPLAQADRQLTQAEEQRQAEARAALLNAGLQLLFPQRRSVRHCTGHWAGPTWVQTCF